MEDDKRLKKYTLEDKLLVLNFANFSDAVEYLEAKGGEFSEVVFTKDSDDNPIADNSAGLVEMKKTFWVELSPEYVVLYSDSEGFQEKAEELLVAQKKFEGDTTPEDWFADQNVALGDKIIILKNGEVNTITTRERIKYLMEAKVYELGVKSKID